MEKLLTPLTGERRDNLTKRETEKPEPDRASPRTPAQRDRDRVLYSSAFQRLAYVTQVTASEAGHTFHNRLSHSLKVAQVGRRNLERLQAQVEDGELEGDAAALVTAADPDSVEACCLAHDLGHPPFGPIAEEELHSRARDHVDDGFEGNAQSFRIVTRLSVRAESAGLNLTRQTLDGMLKYPWKHWDNDPLPGEKRERKWGYYQDDSDAFEFTRAGWPEEAAHELPERCFEAELMEWADDVTFAVHDTDDFFRAGLVPLDRLAEPSGEESKRFLERLAAAKAAEPKAFPDRTPEELVEAAARVIGGFSRTRGALQPYDCQPSRDARVRVQPHHEVPEGVSLSTMRRVGRSSSNSTRRAAARWTR